jgi:hypothetical protein
MIDGSAQKAGLQAVGKGAPQTAFARMTLN